MYNIISELLNTIIQLLIFSLFPVLYYFIKYKKISGVISFIGLKRCNSKSAFISITVAAIFTSIFLLIIYSYGDLYKIMTNGNSVTGKLKKMPFHWSIIIVLLVIAFIKTALAEEILFRGFLAKFLIKKLGFKSGNILQALIFGILHLLLFAFLTNNIIVLFLCFVFPFSIALIGAYINEKKANGSILPSFIIHGLSNFITYTTIVFLFP